MFPYRESKLNFAVVSFVFQCLYRSSSSGCKVTDTVRQHGGSTYSVWHGEVGRSFMIVTDFDDYCFDR